MSDRSNGYEEHAATFMRSRNPQIGANVVRDWASQFARGSEVLELGCGHGVVSQILLDAGLNLFAVDSSPALLDAFHRRFPHVETDCSTAEESAFFNREFDGVLAWGVLFLLEENAQRAVLAKVSKALRPGGHLLFTAPFEPVAWSDSITNLPSRSLGEEAYRQLLHESGLQLSSGITDDGNNNYYFAEKLT